MLLRKVQNIKIWVKLPSSKYRIDPSSKKRQAPITRGAVCIYVKVGGSSEQKRVKLKCPGYRCRPLEPVVKPFFGVATSSFTSSALLMMESQGGMGWDLAQPQKVTRLTDSLCSVGHTDFLQLCVGGVLLCSSAPPPGAQLIMYKGKTAGFTMWFSSNFF